MDGLYPIIRRKRVPLVKVADAVVAAGLKGPAATAAHPPASVEPTAKAQVRADEEVPKTRYPRPAMGV